MKLFVGWKIRNIALALMLAVVLLLSTIVAFVDYNLGKKNELDHIDSRLFSAATFADSILPQRYHDYIENSSSVSPENYRVIVSENNELCRKIGMEYLWSLMILDGKTVFTSATSPDKVSSNDFHAKFLDPHFNPEIYARAFETMEVQYQDMVDEWGNIRAVLIPQYDMHGRKYLIGAGIKQEDIGTLMLGILQNAVMIAIAFLIPGTLISLLVANRITRPIATLATVAEDIGAGKLSEPVDLAGSHEINVVAAQLEAMRKSVQENIAALHADMAGMREFKATVNASPIIFYRLRFAPGSWPVEFISDNIDQLGYSATDLMDGKIRWYDVNVPEDIPNAEQRAAAALERDDEFNFETRLLSADGKTRQVESWNRFTRDDHGEITHIQGLFKDITELQNARRKEALHLQRLTALVDELRDFEKIVNSGPIVIFKLNLRTDFSTEFISENISIAGYSAKAIMSGETDFKTLVPPDSLKKLRERLGQALADGEETYTIQTEIRWANGEIRPYENWYRIIKDESGAPLFLQGMSVDIKEQHSAKERDTRYQKRLKALAQDLLEAESRERRQLAYALHDDIGQMLAALNMKFTALKEASGKERIDDLTQQTEELLSHIMQTTKTLTWEISPTSLYETDIAAGLEHMAEDLKTFFGLEINLQTAGMRIELDRETAAIVFQCAKELLVNIAKHSGEHRAEVGISQYGDKVHFVVADQGKGFDPSALDEGNGNGFGLFSIRERLEHVGGSMHVESDPGAGTKVMMVIPLDISALS